MKNNGLRYIYVGHADQPYGPWKLIPDTPEERQKAIAEGYTAGSTNSFAVEFEKYSIQSNLVPGSSLGPLFIEFEAKRSPAVAINLAREFIIKKLVDACGVDPGCLLYWMNGSKGCHIEIPAAIYGGENGRRELPSIQREMLWHLGLYEFYDPKIYEFVDYSRHCVLGTLIQWPNIKRNNRRYKVPVSCEEFFNLDYPELRRLTYAPRINFDPGTKQPIPSPRLVQLYTIVAGWRRKFTKGKISLSSFSALSFCRFIGHCIHHQATLSEPYWEAMVSILSSISSRFSTSGNLGRETIHYFSRDYPGYSFEETEKLIMQRRVGQNQITCNHVKLLGFDCNKDCGVRGPVDRLNW